MLALAAVWQYTRAKQTGAKVPPPRGHFLWRQNRTGLSLKLLLVHKYKDAYNGIQK